jgi:hypothetical protein
MKPEAGGRRALGRGGTLSLGSLLFLLAAGCGTSGESEDTSPFISSVSPSSGSPTGGTPVAIAGANFQNGAVVYFASVKVESRFESTSSMTASTPPFAVFQTLQNLDPLRPCQAEGSVAVTVLNPDLHAFSLQPGFTYTDC